MATKKTFEQSMERLNIIVDLLEKNEQPLDETIKLFEEGLGLVQECDKQLKGFEKKIDELASKKVEE
ncbi:exodeoxyribonuclease VII small subunit [Anaerorhabdus furcosa]|uniref:Exodeoxyribonuclease 7 small subunit n=1 Tax=Anaerorhabdus furcosa TaxID=118967 RepID=A0A1T4PFL7_9FIRM|nr:exodeoxyribonuclease VII small subunit [Anaerorhabdus furcosa]SJZ90269.1 Exodeoxyribonuclease VII small subunit [Anaerorhabdus furcosa]